MMPVSMIDEYGNSRLGRTKRGVELDAVKVAIKLMDSRFVGKAKQAVLVAIIVIDVGSILSSHIPFTPSTLRQGIIQPIGLDLRPSRLG